MTTPHDLPIACELTPDALQERKADLLPGLVQRAEAIEQIVDGLKVRFTPSSDTLRELTAMIDAERQCCKFLRFELTIEPGGGPMWLVVTGPPGTGAFLNGLVRA